MAIKRDRQAFNSGICVIFNVVNDAKSGNMPIEKISQKERLRFDERTVGMFRYNEFLQNDVEISRVIRAPRRKTVSTQDVIKVSGDNEQYRIVQIQYPRDVIPPCMDLSLERIENRYGEA